MIETIKVIVNASSSFNVFGHALESSSSSVTTRLVLTFILCFPRLASRDFRGGFNKACRGFGIYHRWDLAERFTTKVETGVICVFDT